MEPATMPPEFAMMIIIIYASIAAVFIGGFYAISSYSLMLLAKHYQKNSQPGLLWIPFYRFYFTLRYMTGSAQKALLMVVVPVGTILAGLIIGIGGGFISAWLHVNAVGGGFAIVGGLIFIVGLIAMFAERIYRAFVMSKYVGGDLTTTFFLWIQMPLTLWYIALDRVYHKTDIIGLIGFIVVGLSILISVGGYVMIILSLLAALGGGNLQ